MLREIAELVRRRRVSAVEFVEQALKRIEQLNRNVNAVVGQRPEEALAEARSVDERVRQGEEVGLLCGVPFLVKDNMDVAGMRTTWGSLVLADAPLAVRDDLTPARLRAAGAIPVGKANVPEYCMEGFTSNRLFGTTSNPWAPDWSPGGSSGGSAAAMAAGIVPFATATDGGGSIRIPSAFCGLFGLKPTNGVIPRDPIPFWIDYSTDGPIGVCLDDVRLLLQVQAGPSSGDPTAPPHPLFDTARDELSGPARIGAQESFQPSEVYAAPHFVDWGPLPNPVAELFENALVVLEKDLSLRVQPMVPRELLHGGNIDEDWSLIANVEFACLYGREAIERDADALTPRTLTALRSGLEVSTEEYVAARRRRFDYVRQLDDLLGTNSVIVTPTMSVIGFLADGRMPGEGERWPDDSPYNTRAMNVTGHPALSVPAGIMSNGVPFGLQVIGPRFRDDLLLSFGEAWENVSPSPRAAPGCEAFLQ